MADQTAAGASVPFPPKMSEVMATPEWQQLDESSRHVLRDRWMDQAEKAIKAQTPDPVAAQELVNQLENKGYEGGFLNEDWANTYSARLDAATPTPVRQPVENLGPFTPRLEEPNLIGKVLRGGMNQVAQPVVKGAAEGVAGLAAVPSLAARAAAYGLESVTGGRVTMADVGKPLAGAAGEVIRRAQEVDAATHPQAVGMVEGVRGRQTGVIRDGQLRQENVRDISGALGTGVRGAESFLGSLAALGGVGGAASSGAVLRNLSGSMAGQKLAALDEDPTKTEGQKIARSLAEGAIGYGVGKVGALPLLQRIGAGAPAGIPGVIGHVAAEVPKQAAIMGGAGVAGALADAATGTAAEPDKPLLARILEAGGEGLGSGAVFGLTGLGAYRPKSRAEVVREVFPTEVLPPEDVLNAPRQLPRGAIPLPEAGTAGKTEMLRQLQQAQEMSDRKLLPSGQPTLEPAGSAANRETLSALRQLQQSLEPRKQLVGGSRLTLPELSQQTGLDKLAAEQYGTPRNTKETAMIPAPIVEEMSKPSTRQPEVSKTPEKAIKRPLGLFKEKGTAKDASGMEFPYIRQAEQTLKGVEGEVYSDGLGFGLTAPTLAELKSKMSEKGKEPAAPVAEAAKPSVAEKPLTDMAAEVAASKPEKHVAVYNGKSVPMDYVSDPKREFNVAAQRVQDNLQAGQKGYVVTPKGETFEISWGKKTAKRLPKQEPTNAVQIDSTTPEVRRPGSAGETAQGNRGQVEQGNAEAAPAAREEVKPAAKAKVPKDEHKAKMLADVEAAIEMLPESGLGEGSVSIQLPSGGFVKIPNTKPALETMQKRLRKTESAWQAELKRESTGTYSTPKNFVDESVSAALETYGDPAKAADAFERQMNHPAMRGENGLDAKALKDYGKVVEELRGMAKKAADAEATDAAIVAIYKHPLVKELEKLGGGRSASALMQNKPVDKYTHTNKRGRTAYAEAPNEKLAEVQRKIAEDLGLKKNEEGGYDLASYRKPEPPTPEDGGGKAPKPDPVSETTKAIKQKLTRASSGVDPTLATDFIKLAGQLMAKGATKFSEFVKHVRDNMPEAYNRLRGRMQAWWEEAKAGFLGKAPAITKEVETQAQSYENMAKTAANTVSATMKHAAQAPNRNDIAGAFDAARTNAARVAVNDANRIRVMASDGKGAKPTAEDKLAREAATMIHQAGFSQKELAEQGARIKGKNAEADKAVDYALANFDRLVPVAKEMLKMTDKYFEDLQNAGYDVGYHQRYLMGVYEGVPLQDMQVDSITGKGGSSFMKQKVFDTMFDAIDNGYKPKTLDSADLIEAMSLRANQKVNDFLLMREGLKQLKFDGKPLATDLVATMRPRVGKEGVREGEPAMVAPPGYRAISTDAGRIAVLEQYANLVENMQRPSAIWKVFPQFESFLKHNTFAYDIFHGARVGMMRSALGGTVGEIKKMFGKDPAASSYGNGLAASNYRLEDLPDAVAKGFVTQAQADWALANRPKLDGLEKAGANLMRVSDAIYKDIVPLMPFAKGFNKWIFDELSRGAMNEGAVIMLDRNAKLHPEWSQQELYRNTAKEINTYFRNLGSQVPFGKTRTAQDVQRLLLFAPQWWIGGLLTEGKAVAGLAKAPKLAYEQFKRGELGKKGQPLPVGNLTAAVASLVLANLAVNQFVNFASRGTSTFDNPEKGHELDAYVPGPAGTEGFHISPLTVAMENLHQMMKYFESSSSASAPERAMEAAGRIAKNKLSPLGQAGRIAVQGTSWDDRSLAGADRAKEIGKSLVPVPFAVKGLADPRPGSLVKTLVAMGGVKLDAQESPTSYMYQRANDFLRENGLPTREKYARAKSDYTDLNAYLKWSWTNGDVESAKNELKRVIAKHGADEVLEHYKRYSEPTFTGSRENEAAFLEGMNDFEAKTYERAMEERQKIYETVMDLISQVEQ